MAVTLARLRAMLSWGLGIYVSSSLTSDGNAGGTTLVDTGILKYDGNTLKNKWVLLTSGTYSGQSRRVSSVSSSTITVVSAFGGQVLSAVTYEIVPWDPDAFTNAFQQASRTLYPSLYLPVTDYSLATDNLLTNPSFEAFSVTFTGWSNIGTPTLAQSTRRKNGLYSASINATGAVEGIEQNILTSLNALDAIGKTLHVQGWTWDDAASSSRLRLTFDGSAYTNGTYNTGDGEWNHETGIDVAIPADLTEATVSCETASGETGLFDLVVAWVEGVVSYTVPSSIQDLHYVEYHVDDNRPDGLFRPYSGSIPSGRSLKLRGKSYLTAPTSSASVELTEPQAELLVAQTGVYLFQAMVNIEPGNAASYQVNEIKWEKRVAELKAQPGIVMPRMGADERRWWSVPWGTTTLLLLDR